MTDEASSSVTGHRRSGRETDSPYRLRGNSKLPTRYRDDLEPERDTRASSATGHRGKRPRGRPPSTSVSPVKRTSMQSPSVASNEDSNSEPPPLTPRTPKKTPTLKREPPPSSSPVVSQVQVVDVDEYNFNAEDNDGDDSQSLSGYPPTLRARMYVGAQGGARRLGSDLSSTLREELRRLKNLLKLPKARRWVYCEFFYSDIDEQLFLGDNDFSLMLREFFPNLKTRMLCRPEWRCVRRLIGKPRRCSAAFLAEERQALDLKRQRIRQIHSGDIGENFDFSDLPTRIPRPLVVGAKVYARVRASKDGIYAGTVDAVLPDAYRVVFEKEETIMPMLIKDCEVMSEQKADLVSISYFLEQNRATMPPGMNKLGPPPAFIAPPKVFDKTQPLKDGRVLKKSTSHDEKVGNFPVRMLVILVKLAKLIEMKRDLVRQLTELNTEAEKTNLLTSAYPQAFQERYAQTVVDLEVLNKQMQTYMSGIAEYTSNMQPQLSDVTATVRPEALRKLCNTHAVQIVKHCNNGLNVQNKKALELVTSLTSLLLQVRSLGQQRCTPLDLHMLNESMNEIRAKVSPANAGAFEDSVEVHMKQIHVMMLQNGAL